MTCTNYCCGFIALSGMIGLGSLTVSHGLGSCEFNPIVFPAEDPYKGGKGLETIIRAHTLDGPRMELRFPEIPLSECDKPPSRAGVYSGPRTLGSWTSPPKESSGAGAQAVTTPAPTLLGAREAPAASGSGARAERSARRAPRVSGEAAAPAPGPATAPSRASSKRGPKVAGEAPEPPAAGGGSGARPSGGTRRGPRVTGKKQG